MKIFVETERLILREIRPSDLEAFFEMDSNPAVHQYLGNSPIKTREEAADIIQSIRQQYLDYGIGRWAAIEKSSGNFIGWSGLKFITVLENKHINFHDVGYRFIPKYWGKGYATESAKAALQYGFITLNLKEIIGIAHAENTASRKALEKCGLQFIEPFEWRDLPCDWLKISRTDWDKQVSS